MTKQLTAATSQQTLDALRAEIRAEEEAKAVSHQVAVTAVAAACAKEEARLDSLAAIEQQAAAAKLAMIEVHRFLSMTTAVVVLNNLRYNTILDTITAFVPKSSCPHVISPLFPSAVDCQCNHCLCP